MKFAFSFFAKRSSLAAQTMPLVRTTPLPPLADPTAMRSLSATSPLSKTGEPKPYTAIPGPLKLPFLGTIWDLILFPSNWRKPINTLHLERVKRYGMIYRETLPVYGDIIMTYDPSNVQRFFQAEGKYPTRIPFSMWVHARKELKMEMGIILSEGEEWHKQRVPMSKFAMVPRKVADFHEDFNTVAVDFVRNICKLRDPTTFLLPDVVPRLHRWTFENVALFVLGERLGCLDDPVPPDCQEWIDIIQDLLVSTQKVMMKPPIYKFVPTKAYTKMKECWQRVYQLAIKRVKERMEEITAEDRRLAEAGEGEEEEAPAQVDFLTYLMHSGTLTIGEVAINSIDMVTSAVDTTSITMGWTLYFLARNPEGQEKLRREVQSVVGTEEVMTPTHINNMPYLRNCIKETLRLCPLAAISRVIKNDIVLSGYQIPAGAKVSTSGTVTGRLPELFPEPESYKPERWDKENKDTPHPFASLPFGFGPRMCIGRRVAELAIYVGLAHIMKSFQLTYPSGEEVQLQQKFVIVPDRPINVAFTDI